MSATENGTKPKFETILNNIRKEAAKMRESNDKLRDLQTQLTITEHPASAQILLEATTTTAVALEHMRAVFREF